ncbi:MAG TPA: hypothetical protein VMV40_07945 [Acidiferrobacter sp.]|nr:hypothetical protein [Acidiferrobacter sp.]
MEDSEWTRLDGLLVTQPTPSLAALRQDFPGLVFVRCDAEDLADSSPFRRYPTADVFLVDTRNHCLSMTQSLAEATGLLVAERAPDT